MITKATEKDVDEIVALVNGAYRGESSKAGWTTEADLIEGNSRINADGLRKEFADESVTILKYTNGENDIVGTVYLKINPQTVYLGMLSVKPTLQSSGIGKQLMQAAEVYAVQQQRFVIEMTVINVRSELIAWYKKLGYSFIGQQKPFPTSPIEKPAVALHFEVMTKHLAQKS